VCVLYVYVYACMCLCPVCVCVCSFCDTYRVCTVVETFQSDTESKDAPAGGGGMPNPKARFIDTDQEELGGQRDPILGFRDTKPRTFLEAIAHMRKTHTIPYVDVYAEASVKFANEFMMSHPHSLLHKDEVAALNMYTRECGFYTAFNCALRHVDRSRLLSWFPYLKLFVEAVEKLEVHTPAVLYRGVKKDFSKVRGWGVMGYACCLSFCFLSAFCVPLSDPL
jgi:hypothetical protein